MRLVLENAAEGRLRDLREFEFLDFKEEAGRRSGPDIEPGGPQNQAAATQMADEVACFANTPDGGVLILGVEGKSGKIIGTELDRDWLRQRIYQQVGVAPDIAEEIIQGQRLLVLYVEEAREPVENTANALRWRVGDQCVAVDRAEWWEQRDHSRDIDQFAQRSEFTFADVSQGAVSLAREWAEADDMFTDEEVLRALGVLRSDGQLTEAGALLFIGQNRSYLELAMFDVPGGGSDKPRSWPSTSDSARAAGRDDECSECGQHFCHP